MDDVLISINFHIEELRKDRNNKEKAEFNAFSSIKALKFLIDLKRANFEDMFYKVTISDPMEKIPLNPYRDSPYAGEERCEAFANLTYLYAYARSSLKMRAAYVVRKGVPNLEPEKSTFQHFLRRFSQTLVEIVEAETSLLEKASREI